MRFSSEIDAVKPSERTACACPAHEVLNILELLDMMDLLETPQGARGASVCMQVCRYVCM